MSNTTTPKWRELSGLTPEFEKTLDGKERRAALRKIYEATELEIRIELQLAAEDNEFPGERTFLWEPLSAVCTRLEISQAALTRFLKELTGLTATQLVDRIRAEGLREKLRQGLIAFVTQHFGAPGRKAQSKAEFWKKLKTLRRDESFSFATHAVELGFSNYSRLYRASMLKYGKTPMQLEDEILREIADFYTIAAVLETRIDGTATQPYNDDWTQAESKRREWLLEMATTVGLDNEAAQYVRLK